MSESIDLQAFYERLFKAIAAAAEQTGEAIVSVNGLPIGIFKSIPSTEEDNRGEPELKDADGNVVSLFNGNDKWN